MIKYKLICKNCNISFDSWFASSHEFEKLKKKKFLSCLNCNSKKIDKSLMAPKLINKSKNGLINSKKVDYLKIDKKIREYQRFIKNNFDYVGENFTYEARSIHYNNKKRTKGIFGTASNRELQELKEEGIEAEIIPWVEDKN